MPQTKQQELDELITLWAEQLQCPVSLNPMAILKALAMRESRYGLLTTPRREPSYLPRGRNCNEAQGSRLEQFGSAAACSYSSFQIMFPTACEMGYRGDPHRLGEDREAIRWVIELL